MTQFDAYFELATQDAVAFAAACDFVSPNVSKVEPRAFCAVHVQPLTVLGFGAGFEPLIKQVSITQFFAYFELAAQKVIA